MAEIVTLEIRDHIAFVTLNRPEKYNALNLEMFYRILEVGEAVKNDPSIRAVVLSGNGKGFCAGLDFEIFEKLGADPGGHDLFDRPEDNPANKAQQVAWVWKQVPVPVIAALHGVAFGGGIQLALAADIRLAAADTRMSVMEIKWGLVPDMSGSQTLCDLVRLDVAKELVFTGRIVEAAEAAELGLVTRICEDPRGEAEKLAKVIAGKSPDAISRGKQLLEEAWRSGPEKGLLLEETLQRELIATPNQIEAVMANLEKRPPVFQDRG
ncbi:MAG: crotonase/enoyl-CoA hydratase family protein [Desulfobacterales bacterium]|nr:crotonase/enoyl-CoA hydratase family protein [Desulfobacterales bacterium]